MGRNDVMGVIYTSKEDISLRELTTQRAVAALPVAARYRIIDFTISNLVNSGIRNVGIIAQRNYRSLMDHLGSGKEWDLHTRNNGLFILPPFLTRENSGEYAGTIEALRANFNYLRQCKQEYCILTNSDYIMNTNFEPMIRQHIKSGADITLAYQKATRENTEYIDSSSKPHCYVALDEDSTISDFEVCPNAPRYDNLFLNIMVIKRNLLIYLVDQASARGGIDLSSDILRPFIQNRTLKIIGYEEKAFYRRIETIKGYFNFNLETLSLEVRHALFGENPVYTKTRDTAPTIYRGHAKISNSLIGDGCVIDGAVENCIIFRGVHIGSNAKLKNCVIMQDCYVEDDVELENIIFDKNVTIRNHGRLIGERQYPIVIAKNTTL